MTYTLLTSAEMGKINPAQVDMTTGEVYINADVWPHYTAIQQKFIILHEIGHYSLNTDDETKADSYALARLAGTIPQSLRTVLQEIAAIQFVDDSRLLALYRAALKIDIKKNKNPLAIAELNQLKNMKLSGRISNLHTNNATGNVSSLQPTTEKETRPTRLINIELPQHDNICWTNFWLAVIAIILYTKLSK